MNPEAIWQAALGELEISLSQANFATWFKGSFILSIDKGRVTLGVPSGFTKEWLQNKFHQDILSVLKKFLPDLEDIQYKVATKKIPEEKEKIQTAKESTYQEGFLNPRNIFDNFVVGNSNKLAHAASLAVVKKPGTTYNPLFIWGGVGLGKTHLLQAIGNEIIKLHPVKKVLYVSSEKFTNEFIQAIQKGQANKFKNTYRVIDALLIDDIQFLAGKESTQEEFFHTFNALHQNNKQIVLTSDRPPKAIPTLEDRLKSRFEWGMTCDIAPPDFEMRKAILQAKASEKKFSLPDNVTDFIAQSIQQNIRELEGALNRLMAYLELNDLSPSVETASAALGNLISPKNKSITFDKIVETVADFYNLKSEELFSPKRNKEIVLPRQIVMYLVRQELQYSFPQIANKIGKKDHTTIMHGYNKIEKNLRQNQDIQREISLIKERLYL